MEEVNPLEQTALISELTQGRDLANQLKNLLDHLTSRDTCDILLEKILSSYDKALSVLNRNALPAAEAPPVATLLASCHPIFNGGEGSDGDCKDQAHREVVKKRKTSKEWSHQVKICSGMGLEGPLDDGHSWRKYGQKEILGATHPRAYYRCTHRHTRGCLATKQVQRSEVEPSTFEITYRGRHSCVQSFHSIPSEAKPKENISNSKLQHEAERQIKALETLMKVGTGLKVEAEDLETKANEIFPCFPILSMPFDDFQYLENQFLEEPLIETKFVDSYSPQFTSPATSDSNCFSLSSPCQTNDFPANCNLQTSETCEFNDLISTPTSVMNSPFGGLNFSVPEGDFNSEFHFQTLLDQYYP